MPRKSKKNYSATNRKNSRFEISKKDLRPRKTSRLRKRKTQRASIYSKTRRVSKNIKRSKRAAKKHSPLVLVKFPENPVISPRTENDWEAWQTFNPGIILLEDKVHILYRAIGEDGISRLGYVVSGDGFTIDERLSYPVYEHGLKNKK